MSGIQENSAPLDYGLLANSVHQIINPLNGVSGTLDNLADGTIAQPQRITQRTKAARAQLEQCILLIRNLAFILEISADPSKLEINLMRKTCVIPQIVIEAAMFFQELGASKGMTIQLEDRQTQYAAQGNPDLLRQVFMNLFDNAVKYGIRNSEVNINPWVQKRTNVLMVQVTGTSLYIPPAERESVFAVGFRSSSAKDKIASGTGLGLYICRMILQYLFGATIVIDSSSRSGAVSILMRFPSFRIGNRE